MLGWLALVPVQRATIQKNGIKGVEVAHEIQLGLMPVQGHTCV